MQLKKNNLKIIPAILAGILIFAAIVAVFSWIKAFVKNDNEQIPVENRQNPKEENDGLDPKTRAQIKELDALSKQHAGGQTLSEEKIAKQVEDLERISKNMGTDVLSEETIETQLAELESLKNNKQK